MIRIFTPSFADAANTNAQNLTVKEIVARLPPDSFQVTMIRDGDPDERLAARPNTRFIQWLRHGNAGRLLSHCLGTRPHIYFYPREGVLDLAFLRARRYLGLRTGVVTHVVKCFDQNTAHKARGTSDRALQAAIREADAVYGNSHYVSETVTRRFGVPAETIHNGVDPRFFYEPSPNERRSIRAGRLIVLYAGSLQARKRPDLVIRLAQRWPAVTFRMAGDGEERATCERLIQGLRLRNVTLLGHLPPQDLGREMRESDIFLFPSLVEGHPQVLGQAAASALPVLAMRTYRPDAVIDGRTGFLANDDEELAQALRRLIEEQTLRVTMGELGLQHAALFDWNEAATKWQEVFGQVAAKLGRGPAFRGLRITIPAKGVTVTVPRLGRQESGVRSQETDRPVARKLANY